MSRTAVTFACLVLLSGCRMPWESIDATEPAAPAAPGTSDPNLLPAGGGFGNLDPGITGQGGGAAVEAQAPAAKPRPRPVQLAQANTSPHDDDDLLPGLDDIPAGSPRGQDQLGDIDIDLDDADYRPPPPPRGPRGRPDRYRDPGYDSRGGGDDYRPERGRRHRDDGYDSGDHPRGRRDRGGDDHGDRGGRDRGRRNQDDSDDGRRGRRRGRELRPRPSRGVRAPPWRFRATADRRRINLRSQGRGPTMSATIPEPATAAERTPWLTYSRSTVRAAGTR